MLKRKLLPALVVLMLFVLFPRNAYSVEQEHVLRSHVEKFSSDQSFDGIYAQCMEFFHVGNWQIEQSKLCLYFSATQLLAGQEEFAVLLNGTVIYKGNISVTDGSRQSIEIPLPAQYLHLNGVNSIAVEAKLYGENEACTDAAATSNWFNVFKESFVSLQYISCAPCDNIAEFYQAFTSIDALEGSQSAVCLLRTSNASVYSAAAYALSGFSAGATLSYENIGLRFIDSLSDMEQLRYAVLFCTYDDLPKEIADLLSYKMRASAQNGAIAELVKKDETHLLVVTGNDSALLEKAGVMLANSTLMRQTVTTAKVLRTDARYTLNQARIPQYFALTESPVMVKGIFRRTAQFAIDYPANRTIASSSQLSLDYRYGGRLMYDRSLMTVYIDDVPVASKKLSLDLSQGDSILIDIPPDLKITGSFNVKVVFDFDVGDEWCNLLEEEMPWASVESTSMFKLASTDQAPLLFENYPSPFLRDGRFDNLVVVLPDAPQEVDLEAMRQILLTLGCYLKDNTGVLRIAFSSQPGELNQSNVIAIGKAKENRIASENRDVFAYSNDGTRMKSKELPFHAEYANMLGTAQLLQSPYSKRAHALLILSATTDKGLLHAASLLQSTGTLWKLSDDAAVSDGEKVYCFRHDRGNGTNAPIAPDKPSGKRAYGILLPGGALLLLVIGIAMMAAKYARKDRL